MSLEGADLDELTGQARMQLSPSGPYSRQNRAPLKPPALPRASSRPCARGTGYWFRISRASRSRSSAAIMHVSGEGRSAIIGGQRAIDVQNAGRGGRGVALAAQGLLDYPLQRPGIDADG